MFIISNVTKRLAHFVPTTNNNIYEIKKDIILSAFYYSNKTNLTTSDLKKEIKDKLGIKMSLNEINLFIEKLDSKIIKNNNTLNLLPNVVTEIKKQIEEETKLKSKVLNEWIYNEIKHNYPSISKNEIKILKNDLEIFIKKLFIRHGTESLSLITSEIENNEEDLDMNSVIESLPKRSKKIRDIEYMEFTKFFNSNDKNRFNYLIKEVDKAFKYLSSVCDTKIIKEFSNKLKNKKIFLDSSVVYRLVNLQGERRYKVIKDVVEICNKFNLDLRISLETLKELKRRLSFDSKVLKDYPVECDLAAVGYNYLTEDNYVTTYWYEASRNGMSIDDFITHYSHIDDILENEGVTVEKEEREFDSTFEEIIIKYIRKIRYYENPNGYTKSDSAVEHDAYNLAMIEQLRGAGNNSFIDSSTWFLTTDHLLIKLQKQDDELHNNVPLAILPSQLIQILRFITPTKESYDEAFIGLFSNSIRTSSTSLNTRNVQAI